MLDTLFRLFHDLDYFAECASEVDIQKYKDIIRSNQIYSHDGSEEGGYFCALPKIYCNSVEMAVSLLFINCLYEHEEWNKDESLDTSDRVKWKSLLKEQWIPAYFDCKGSISIEYKQVKSLKNFPIADKLLHLAIPSPPVLIFRYGMINAWNSYNYLIETETEYIDFQSWTMA